ncbi:arylesterase [Cycloclasticus pugetii]|uniref:arylesterase n=1 Tax=Cycloclasticus pugetii TaxID=34068 RepID=UPI00091F530B|nr:arylesterase [Cycloclasticus pugetii]SHI95934.1 acyl-CoA thioesterase-1 [Cycloclasticus pugetii]
MIRIYLLLVFALFSSAPFAKTIVVLGDSISASYGMPIEKGWVNLLQQTLNEQNKPYTLINKSISGDTTAGGLARIDQALEQHTPEIVLLELGANDGLRGMPPTLIKKNLRELVKRIKANGAQTLLLSMRIPSNYGQRYTEMFYSNYPELAEEMDIPFVPFILEDVALEPDMMQADQLHPNEKAQPIIAQKIWDHLEPILQTN